ncbi:DMT family transporter [Miniphocaeibacter halophilus]|uniref:DMT family transporter n=1 Tax=Miniphocaeibacter halophilus TaxID=2931922 RepID=A0AC61MUP6_9FIRM|nr:DMT family transporter [Miniphocaeibacter halophilus]QQK08474.1 DMT family transporter [Miniphocaeibacter halophilus]
MDRLFKEKKFYIPIILFCMFLWGSAFPIIKLSYIEFGIPQGDYFAKIYFAGLRFFLSGVMVTIFGKIFLKEKINFKKLDYKFLAILGLIQITFQYTFYYIGVGNTSGMKSAIIQSASTFFIVLFASMLFKDDKINKNKIASIVIGFLGIIITNISSGFDFNFTLTGEGFLLIATLFGSIGQIYVKAAGKSMNPVVATSGQMLIGASILILVGRIGTSTDLIWTGKGILLFIYSGFLSSAAFVLWYSILKYNKAGEVSVYRLFIPIFGTILSALFLPGERITINIIIGLILVVIGMFVLNMRWERK